MYLLIGLRQSEDVALQLLEGVGTMHESTTYHAILREGRIEGRNEGLIEGTVRGEQRGLLILGEIRFGTPDESIRKAVESIRDLEHLERLIRRVMDSNIHDWERLLETV